MLFLLWECACLFPFFFYIFNIFPFNSAEIIKFVIIEEVTWRKKKRKTRKSRGSRSLSQQKRHNHVTRKWVFFILSNIWENWRKLNPLISYYRALEIPWTVTSASTVQVSFDKNPMPAWLRNPSVMNLHQPHSGFEVLNQKLTILKTKLKR